MANRWFENDCWDTEIENLFFQKLSRARKEVASQYLRIQSTRLLKKQDNVLQDTAFRLMKKLFSEYPDEYIDVCVCHNALAEYFYKKCDYNESYKHYEYIRNYNVGHPQAQCNYTMSEIGLIKNIIQLNDPSKLQYAKELIIEIYPYFKNKFNFLDSLRKEYLNVCKQINEIIKDAEIEKIIQIISDKPKDIY